MYVHSGRIGLLWPQVFQLCEHVLNLVTLFVQDFGVVPWRGPDGSWRDAGLDLAGIQRVAELVAVITFVADQHFGIRQHRINQLCSNMVR